MKREKEKEGKEKSPDQLFFTVEYIYPRPAQDFDRPCWCGAREVPAGEPGYLCQMCARFVNR